MSAHDAKATLRQIQEAARRAAIAGTLNRRKRREQRSESENLCFLCLLLFKQNPVLRVVFDLFRGPKESHLVIYVLPII
jgi:hypothetical protein